MQIQKIQIENFGKLHDFEMELTNGLNVIRASNGWGKSTLAAFLKAMLYGLDYTTKRSLKENERKKYAPWQGGAFGGSMEFAVNEKCYRVERFFGVKDKEDTFRLYDLATELESTDYSERLGEEIFRLDRAAFERSSYFAQQDFAATLNDSLNARLTRVDEDAGDMQNYEKAVASLEERMKYFHKTGNRGQLGIWEQERQAVREDLTKCHEREAALAEWKAKISEKEQEGQELSALLEQTEQLGKDAQEYETKAERHDRYAQLLHQVKSQEEAVQQIGIQLAGYKRAPLSEEALDACHREIFQIHTMEEQGQRTAEELHTEEKNLKEIEKAEKELPHRIGNGLIFGILIIAIILGLLCIFLFKWYVPGAVVFLIGCGTSAILMQKNRGISEQIAQWEAKKAQAEQQLRKKKDEVQKQHTEREALEQKVRLALGVQGPCSSTQLEDAWKQERQKSQEYLRQKQSYREKERELRRSKEVLQEYAGRFTEEEIQEFQQLQKPEKSRVQLQHEAEAHRRRREMLLQEMTRLQNQVRALEESAERIPELEETYDRLTQQIEEGTKEHEMLEKTVKYLKTARDQFSTRYLKELQQGLLTYLSEMEPDTSMAPSLDVKLKVKLREAGAARELDYFSAGWQDLIQIAERFAIVDALYEEEQPVLILDDPFVNLDNEKQQRAMTLLEKLAQKWQMIYFTCHEA
jgi:DNA repair exonuclease SbcCD ATPase subunit